MYQLWFERRAAVIFNLYGTQLDSALRFSRPQTPHATTLAVVSIDRAFERLGVALNWEIPKRWKGSRQPSYDFLFQNRPFRYRNGCTVCLSFWTRPRLAGRRGGGGDCLFSQKGKLFENNNRIRLQLIFKKVLKVCNEFNSFN